MALQFRQLGDEDLTQLVSCLAAWRRAERLTTIRRRTSAHAGPATHFSTRRHTWMIERNGRPVGYLRFDPGTGEVVGFHLERESRSAAALRQTGEFLLDLGRWLGVPLRLDGPPPNARGLPPEVQAEPVWNRAFVPSHEMAMS